MALQQAGAAELRRREVDGDLEVARPLRGGRTGLTDGPFAERYDQSGLFRQGNECARRDHATLGVVPTNERLETANLIGRKIDNGLVVKLELVGGQGFAQIALQSTTGLHLRVHFRLEKAERPATVALGAVQGQIGIAHDLVWVQSVRRPHRDADAYADDHLVAVDVVGLADDADQPLRQRSAFRRCVDRDLHDRELVATHAGDRVGLPRHLAQPIGHHPQQLVAGGMAERVVDVLEVIEVQNVGGDDLTALGTGQGLLQPLVEQHAVRQTGQRVVHGHVRDLRFGAPLFGDVVMGGYRAAVGHPLHRHRNAATVTELIVELAEIAFVASAQYGVHDVLATISRTPNHCRAGAR